MGLFYRCSGRRPTQFRGNGLPSLLLSEFFQLCNVSESKLAKITAAATAAKRTAQKALAANPNPEWNEHEMQSIDDWIAHQDVKIERSEAIRRLVEIGLKAKK